MPDLQNVLGWNATKNLFQLLVFPAVILTMRAATKDYTLWALRIFAVVDALYLIFTKRGLIEANTFDCGVIACLIPLWFPDGKSKWRDDYGVVAIGIIAFASFNIGSRSGFLAMAAIALTYGFHHARKLKKIYFWGLGVCFIAFSFLGASLYFKTFVRDPRVLMWAHYFDWWLEKINPWIGTGIGGFEWIGLFLPSGFHNYKFYLMHNDWLQTLFETGVIGLTALIVLYAYTLTKLKTLASQSAWLAIGATMFFYYPMHAFVMQVYGLMLMSEAHRVKK